MPCSIAFCMFTRGYPRAPRHKVRHQLDPFLAHRSWHVPWKLGYPLLGDGHQSANMHIVDILNYLCMYLFVCLSIIHLFACLYIAILFGFPWNQLHDHKIRIPCNLILSHLLLVRSNQIPLKHTNIYDVYIYIYT